MGDRLWVTWEKQRRNRTLSAALNAELCEYTYKLPRILKYPLFIIMTVAKVISVWPSILFVQNPSIVLSFVAVFLGKLIKIPVVVDAHNSGVFPFGGKYPWATSVCNLINKTASYVIVTNVSLQKHVENHGGRCLVLPDPIPEIATEKSNNKQNHRDNFFKVLFVCTWSPDEPFQEVIQAAQRLDKSVKIYITGNSQRVQNHFIQDLPGNIELTGYLPDNEYEKMLSKVDIVMDLTTFDDCLVCGAYESVAAEKPIILSNNSASRTYFHSGVVHIENNQEDIVRGINEARNNITKLNEQIIEFKHAVIKEWESSLHDANQKLKNMEDKVR